MSATSVTRGGTKVSALHNVSEIKQNVGLPDHLPHNPDGIGSLRLGSGQTNLPPRNQFGIYRRARAPGHFVLLGGEVEAGIGVPHGERALAGCD
jgi:hypothetical protein